MARRGDFVQAEEVAFLEEDREVASNLDPPTVPPRS